MIPNEVEHNQGPSALEKLPEPVKHTVNEKSEQTNRESWCFVGEDLSGRYCVKVPSEEACDDNRTFKSRADCELVEGSHMPAGITKDGIHFRPLEYMKFSD